MKQRIAALVFMCGWLGIPAPSIHALELDPEAAPPPGAKARVENVRETIESIRENITKISTPNPRVFSIDSRVSNLNDRISRLGKDKMSVKETATEIVVNLSSDVLFDFDRFELRPEAEESLAVVKDLIDTHPGARVALDGHTDSVGSDIYNMKLSRNRASEVADWLVGHGIARRQIRVGAHGESQPVEPNTMRDGSDNPDGRQKNRRVQISIKK